MNKVLCTYKFLTQPVFVSDKLSAQGWKLRVLYLFAKITHAQTMVVVFVTFGWCAHRRRAESEVPLMQFICAFVLRHKQVVDTYGAWCAPVCRRVTHAQSTRSTPWLKKRGSCVPFRLESDMCMYIHFLKHSR